MLSFGENNMEKFFKSIVIIMFFLIITSSSYVGSFNGGIDNATYLSLSKIDSRKIKNIAKVTHSILQTTFR